MRVFLDALSRKPTVSIGTQALIISSMQIITSKFPNAKFVLLSEAPHIDSSFLSHTSFNFELIKRHPSQFKTILQIRGIINKVDIVVSPWGDGYITNPPHLILRKTFFMKKRGVPLILFTSSIGPFSPGLKSWIARLGLKQFDILTVRDSITYEFMKKLRFSNVRLVPDTAFALDSSPPERVEEILHNEGIPVDKKFIGINISVLLLHKFAMIGKNYAADMAHFVEWLKDKFGLPILFLPHQVFPKCYAEATVAMKEGPGGDDRFAIEQVLTFIKNNRGVYHLRGEYTPSEMKGIISRAEIFIGGRMHSVIAAISTGVPSVIMEYSHKASGVMKMLGLENLVWTIKEPNKNLQKLCSDIWEQKDVLSQKLNRVMPDIKKQTYALANEIQSFFH